MTYKATFTKDKRGQTQFQRSLTVKELTLILIVCDEVSVHVTGKNKGRLFFKFFRKDFNTYLEVKNLKFYVLRQFLPPDEWKNELTK